MKLPPPQPRQPREPIGPLVDVVFLLLVFFLLAGTLDPPRVIEVDPPASEHADSTDTDRLRILLDDSGRIGFEGQVLDPDSLAAAIAPRLGAGSHRAVQVEADGNATAGLVLALLGQLRSLGAEDLALAALPRPIDASGDD